MSNEMTTLSRQLANSHNPSASLLDIRKDPKRFPRLRTFSRDQAIFQMSKIISQAFLYKGQAVDPTNIRFMSSSLIDELFEDPERLGTKEISFEEVSRIIKKAVLTDDLYLSVASLYRVLVAYIKGEGHHLEKQVIEMRRRENIDGLKKSIIAPMLEAYAGEMVKNSKV